MGVDSCAQPTPCECRPAAVEGIEPSRFLLVAGESLPLRLTVTQDGNGDEVTDLVDFRVEVLLHDLTRPGASAEVSKTSANGGITIAGNTAAWVWDSTDFPARQVFYVRVTNEEAKILQWGFILTRKP